MIVIKVSCQPKDPEERKKLDALQEKLVSAAIGTEGLGVRDKKDVVCLFPVNRLHPIDDGEVHIEIHFFGMDKPTFAVRRRFEGTLHEMLAGELPGFRVKCSV